MSHTTHKSIAALTAAFLCCSALAQNAPPGAGNMTPNSTGGGSAAVGGSCSANQFATSIAATTATPTCAQPATANTSDYVAGTWTPVLAGSTGAGTPTYAIQAGSYEQIGRNITVRFAINITAWGGSPTGNTTITGLPQATSSAANNYSSCWIGTYTVSGLAASSFGVTGYIAPGSTTITLQQSQTTGAVAITPAQVGTAVTAQFIGECNYHI